MSTKASMARFLRRLIASVEIGALASVPAPALAVTYTTYTILYSFTHGNDGSRPLASVVEDASGTLYGTTSSGGGSCTATSGNPRNGCGTVYSFSPNNGLKTLVSFSGPNGAYGHSPLTLSGTTLYGNTIAGGATGNGVLFSVHTNGTSFSLLHQFDGADGSEPTGALRLAPNHTLYGITAAGGEGYPGSGHGVLFQLTPGGAYTVLHAFTGGADGSEPDTLLITKSGTLVGSTYSGGIKTSPCPSQGCGLVFEYVPSTGKFGVLYSFTGMLDGSEPYLGSLGTGPAVYGVANGLFSITAGIGYAPIAYFGAYDGAFPLSGPTLASGSLIGVNSSGPNVFNASGSLYSEVAGVVTDLHYFGSTLPNGEFDGSTPVGQPLVTPTGSIIGTTESGGPGCSTCGIIYELSP